MAFCVSHLSKQFGVKYDVAVFADSYAKSTIAFVTDELFQRMSIPGRNSENVVMNHTFFFKYL